MIIVVVFVVVDQYSCCLLNLEAYVLDEDLLGYSVSCQQLYFIPDFPSLLSLHSHRTSLCPKSFFLRRILPIELHSNIILKMFMFSLQYLLDPRNFQDLNSFQFSCRFSLYLYPTFDITLDRIVPK